MYPDIKIVADVLISIKIKKLTRLDFQIDRITPQKATNLYCTVFYLHTINYNLKNQIIGHI